MERNVQEYCSARKWKTPCCSSYECSRLRGLVIPLSSLVGLLDGELIRACGPEISSDSSASYSSKKISALFIKNYLILRNKFLENMRIVIKLLFFVYFTFVYRFLYYVLKICEFSTFVFLCNSSPKLMFQLKWNEIGVIMLIFTYPMTSIKIF